MDKYQKLTNTLGNLKKIADFIKKNAKIRGIETLESNPLLLETIQCPIIKPSRRLLGPWSWKNSKNDENFQTWKKMRVLSKNCYNLWYSKFETFSMATKKFSVTYYPTIPLPLETMQKSIIKP